MKNFKRIGLVLILALIGIGFWLLKSADADNLTRTDVIYDLPDTFEK